jgi:hypothetical protein
MSKESDRYEKRMMFRDNFDAYSFKNAEPYIPYEYPDNHMIYEYQCPKCDKIRSELRTLAEDSKYSTEPCVDCEIPMVKIMSSPAGYVKGTSTPCKNK